MKDNVTTFTIELQVAAQKVIHQFMTSNEQVEEMMRKAIEKAVLEFDFESAVKGIVQRDLNKAIQCSMEYGKMKEYVEKKANIIFEKIIEQEMQWMKERYDPNK